MIALEKMRKAKFWKKYLNYLKTNGTDWIKWPAFEPKNVFIGYNTNISQIFVEWMFQNICKSYQVEFVFEKLD